MKHDKSKSLRTETGTTEVATTANTTTIIYLAQATPALNREAANAVMSEVCATGNRLPLPLPTWPCG